MAKKQDRETSEYPFKLAQMRRLKRTINKLIDLNIDFSVDGNKLKTITIIERHIKNDVLRDLTKLNFEFNGRHIVKEIPLSRSIKKQKKVDEIPLMF